MWYPNIDMTRILLNTNNQLPTFYAINFNRLPPVGIEHIDESALMAEVCALKAEVRSVVQLRTDIRKIRSALNPTIQLNAVNNANVAVVSTSNTNSAQSIQSAVATNDTNATFSVART